MANVFVIDPVVRGITGSIRNSSPIVCACRVETACEQVEHGKTRNGNGADAGLHRPRRLS
jgi:hypothetical protein